MVYRFPWNKKLRDYSVLLASNQLRNKNVSDQIVRKFSFIYALYPHLRDARALERKYWWLRGFKI